MSHDKKQRVIHLPAGALEQLQGERMAQIQAYMDEYGKTESIRQATLDRLCLLYVEQRLKEPNLGPLDVFIPECLKMADIITHAKMSTYYEGMREVVRIKNITDIPEAIAWNAKRFGVDLLAPIPETAS